MKFLKIDFNTKKKVNFLKLKFIHFFIDRKKKNPLKSYGTHFITGYMGAGKTLLMNKIIRSVNNQDYFFLSNKKEFLAENVYYFELKKMFSNNQQLYKLPLKDNKGRKLYAVIFDEINLSFNRRNNRLNDYNNVFLPLINFIITCRHQGINRLYFIGQKLELQDTQLQSLFLYKHDIIATKRRFTYYYYEHYEKYNKIPVKLIVLNSSKGENDDYKTIGTSIIKINCDDINTYDTFSFRDVYEGLDIYKPST